MERPGEQICSIGSPAVARPVYLASCLLLLLLLYTVTVDLRLISIVARPCRVINKEAVD